MPSVRTTCEELQLQVVPHGRFGVEMKMRWGWSLIVVVAIAVMSSVSAGAATTGARTVAPERWVRGICRHTSEWLDERDSAKTTVETVNAELAGGELTAKAATKRLLSAYSEATSASGRLVEQVTAQGVPKVDQGPRVAAQFQQRVSEYRDAYEHARTDLAHESTKDAAQYVLAAQAIDATVVADLAETGGDPLEDLRAVPELAAGIEASCSSVDEHLNATVATAGCTAGVATARDYVALLDRLQATAPGSPEETALADQAFELANKWRGDLGGCNSAAVLGPCKPALDTAQQDVAAAARYVGTPADSPEEQAALDEWTRLDAELITQLPECTA